MARPRKSEPPGDDDDVVVTFQIKGRGVRYLDARADYLGVSRSEVVREAVREYVRRHADPTGP